MRAQVRTSNAFNLGMVALLAACTVALGPLAMFKLYFVPYWVNVVWLDLVTYLHHHGAQDAGEKIPWYRGSVRPRPGPGTIAACSAPRGGAPVAQAGAGRALQQCAPRVAPPVRSFGLIGPSSERGWAGTCFAAQLHAPTRSAKDRV